MNILTEIDRQLYLLEKEYEEVVKRLKREKHIPDVKIEGDKVFVQVGSVAHPMLDAHYIQFICLETENGVQIKYLKPGQEPKAEFILNGEKPVAVYEY